MASLKQHMQNSFISGLKSSWTSLFSPDADSAPGRMVGAFYTVLPLVAEFYILDADPKDYMTGMIIPQFSTKHNILFTKL